MFRARTLFVIGAGASAEVGMPIGSELLEKVVKLTGISFEFNRQKQGDSHVLLALKHILNEGHEVTKINEHLHAAWQLAASSKQALSVDNVIDALEDERVELVGKVGIVRAIHQAEEASRMFKGDHGQYNSLNVSNFKDTWYDRFTKLLTEGVRKSEVEQIFDNLEIINFNYDRCIEQYLPLSLANYYGLKPDQFRALMGRLVIHRPYGIAGRLPWQAGEIPAVPFGGGTVEQTAAAASQIRTFTERVEEGDELRLIKEAAANAGRIVFLGFAFHRQNVELVAAKAPENVDVLATAFAISKSDKSVIANELASAFELEGPMPEQGIELADLTCANFFKDYSRTLTADPKHRAGPIIASMLN